jgi:AcrR family transcriptional regulator
MPRAFTETEKEKIRGSLIESGRECFARYGLSKTSIEDLVRSAGIAKASFYLFYESKEALYVETVVLEIPPMIERLLDASFRKTDDTREALVFLMKGIVYEIEANPLTSVLLGYPMDLDRLAATLDVEALVRDAQVMFAPLLDEIRRAQEKGKIVAGDPYELLGVTGLIKVYPVYKKRLPEPWYSTMLDRSAQTIADGLTCSSGRFEEKPARTSRRQALAVRKENPVLDADSPPGSSRSAGTPAEGARSSRRKTPAVRKKSPSARGASPSTSARQAAAKKDVRDSGTAVSKTGKGTKRAGRSPERRPRPGT